MENLGRRKKVVEFISENQGCNAEDIVNGIKNDLSRGPIFDTLRELIKEGAVIDEKINRRDHRFFLNEDNLLVSIPAELDQFKDYYYNLIDEVNRRFDPKIKERDKKYPEHLRKNNVDDLEWKELDPTIKRSRILFSLLALYQHLVGMYILQSLSLWHRKIKDKETIIKLYTEVFNRFQEIQLKLTSELIVPLNEVGLYDVAADSLFELKQFTLDTIANNFYRIGVGKLIEPVIDSLWKISNKSIPFSLLSSHKTRDLKVLIDGNSKLKDWGIFVE